MAITYPQRRVAATEAVGGILRLKPLVLWNAFKRQSLAFWAINFYILIEYVRPQQVWEVIDVLPWGLAALALSIGGLLVEPRVERRFQFLDAALVFYSLVLFASIATAYNSSRGMDGLEVWINWLLLYFLVTRLINTEARLVIFLIGFFLWSFKMSQFGTRSFVMNGFQFVSWGTTGAPGWFHNSGEFAIQMCVFLPLVLHVILGHRHLWPRWQTALLLALFPGTAIVGVIASSSRGGQLATAIVLLSMLAQSRHRVRGLATVAVILPLLWLIVPAEQKQRFAEMGEDDTSQSRLIYWRDGLEIIQDRPILGVGYNNWLPYYRQYHNPVGELPHNIFIEAGAELGLLGLGGFFLLIGGTFIANARTRRMARALPPDWQPLYRSVAFGLDAALIGYLISGFFVTVLYYPYFWMNLSMTSALYLLVSRRYAAMIRANRAEYFHRKHVTPTRALQPT